MAQDNTNPSRFLNCAKQPSVPEVTTRRYRAPESRYFDILAKVMRAAPQLLPTKKPMIESYSLSDTGCTRHDNQDRVLTDHSLGLFVVADGMGGHSHGEKAAE